MLLDYLRDFLRLESASGIILCFTAALALFIVNSPFANSYQLFLYTHFFIGHWEMSLTSIVNEGFMTLFFFLVGLEIKREILTGEFNSFGKIILPGVAAIFGMIVPALIYLICQNHQPENLRGWAIPTATDIAFALGVLNLLGKRIPLSIKVFLTALAIFDDLGAIIIIAIFYTKDLVWFYLLLSAFIFIVLCLLNYVGTKKIWLYLLLSFSLWFCVLQSGVHSTIAGVLCAMATPRHHQQLLEHKLHLWVAFLILPLFAFVNMGLPLTNIHFHTLLNSLPLGIFLGLFFGKQIGVFSSVWLAVKCKLATLPKGSNWSMMYGIALLCGIGFTMSLFIGDLAFNDIQTINHMRLGVLAGSLFSGIFGYIILWYCTKSNYGNRT